MSNFIQILLNFHGIPTAWSVRAVGERDFESDVPNVSRVGSLVTATIIVHSERALDVIVSPTVI